MSAEQPTLSKDIAEHISNFEPTKLRHVENVNEKVVLPSKEDLEDEKKRMSFVNTIESFDPQSLKKTSTVEKNVLPDKETIEAEKKNSQ